MRRQPPTLHLICGKAASGKSTLCAKLGAAENTIIIAEDAWLSALFGDQMTTLKDFARCSARLRSIVGPHVASLLRSGLSVVLDFHANTVASRAWMRTVFEAAKADHKLHVLDTPDEVCLARLRARNAAGAHPFATTEAQFHQLSKHFAPPSPEEGFTIITYESP